MLDFHFPLNAMRHCVLTPSWSLIRHQLSYSYNWGPLHYNLKLEISLVSCEMWGISQILKSDSNYLDDRVLHKDNITLLWSASKAVMRGHVINHVTHHRRTAQKCFNDLHTALLEAQKSHAFLQTPQTQQAYREASPSGRLGDITGAHTTLMVAKYLLSRGKQNWRASGQINQPARDIHTNPYYNLKIWLQETPLLGQKR